MKAYMRVGGGDTLLRGRLSPSIDYVHRDKRDMRNCAEGHSESTNNQALVIPFGHYIKMKAYMRVGGGGNFTLGRFLPPTPPIPTDHVHSDEIGEIVSSILLKGIQKLQITRLFLQSLQLLHKNESIHEGWGGGGTLYFRVDCHPL